MPTLLLVEDQVVFRENLAEALEDHGYVVLQAGDANEAVRALEGKTVDLLLLDVALPGMSGVELLRSLRARHAMRHIPAFFLTAFPRPDVLEEASKLGVGDFLVKSDISLRDLLERIERNLASGSAESFGNSSQGSRMENAVVARRHLWPALRRWRPHPDRPQARELFAATQGEVTVYSLEYLLSVDPQGARWLQKSFGEGFLRTDPEGAFRRLLFHSVIHGAMLSVQASADLRRLWRRALALGLICEQISPITAFSTKFQAFLAGLCVEVPWIFGVQALEMDYPEVRAEAWEEGQAIEGHLAGAFGTNEATMALETLHGMELPDQVWKAVVDLHGAGDGNAIWESAPGGRCLSVASAMVNILEPPWHPCISVRGLPASEASWILEKPSLRHALDRAGEEFRSMLESGAFPEAGPIDPTRAMQVEGTDRKFLYLRQVRALLPDPVESMLSQWGTVEVVDTVEQLANREDVVRVAWVEPESPAWERLMEFPRRTVVLHMKSIPRKGFLGPHEPVSMPVVASVLERALRSRG
ncbi:MAG: response regulator [Fibrobacteres bacterium]|nr:response regulator [Fibrobacterota bacterium]